MYYKSKQKDHRNVLMQRRWILLSLTLLTLPYYNSNTIQYYVLALELQTKLVNRTYYRTHLTSISPAHVFIEGLHTLVALSGRMWRWILYIILRFSIYLIYYLQLALLHRCCYLHYKTLFNTIFLLANTLHVLIIYIHANFFQKHIVHTYLHNIRPHNSATDTRTSPFGIQYPRRPIFVSIVLKVFLFSYLAYI